VTETDERTHAGERISLPPDGRPADEQPQWRKDFAIDWPQDNHVARRDFTKFLVLTSGAFAVGQGWIAVESLLRKQRPRPERKKVASLASLLPGSAITFEFPTAHDPCLLIRTAEGALVAYSQKCTHLSCAVVPKLEQGVLHCPCHEGYFDLLTGRNIAGPPPRPLPRIAIEIEGDDVYAVSVEARTI
jgi:nitrite reductase/ring-hydroxylating ferredoxin subunit